MIIAESCSKMESIQGSVNGLYASDTNICSDLYKPTIHLNAKAETSQTYTSPFANQKVHLFSDSISKATQSLKDQVITVLLLTQCTPTQHSLSDRILKSTDNKEFFSEKQAFTYTIEEDWGLEQLEEAAHADPCVYGVTPPAQITTNSLALPNTSDTHLEKMDHLAFSNYAHAYEYFVKKQNSTVADVALVDSGVDCAHPDLVANLVSNCGFNFIEPARAPTDTSIGHGTHVGGLIGAVANNNLGILGATGSGARIRALKVLTETTTDAIHTYNAIRYAITNNVDVINLSLTGADAQQRIPTLEDAVADAVASGIVVVMAAGNHGLRLGTDALISPAMVGPLVQGAISVGSVDTSSGRLSTFSNFGNQVEIAAPGSVNSYSTDVFSGLYSLAPNRAFQRMSGTSQATPIVSAAAALVIQFLKQRNISYSPADIERILVLSTDAVPIQVNGGRSLNFSKLVRNTYKYAGVQLCP